MKSVKLALAVGVFPVCPWEGLAAGTGDGGQGMELLKGVQGSLLWL